MTPDDVKAYHKTCERLLHSIEILETINTLGDWTLTRRLNEVYVLLLEASDALQDVAPSHVSVDHHFRFDRLKTEA